ncbi:hypothetical protein VPNG_09849 [Cytospora leucostoma]|uniref:N-acetyltransferase ESCO zinc-finger domain-containing protein n=1 Tax=Cytospora leucostoma TaxID=1230097 RepID=A0A423VIL9_9PEZI|nr:hypothetical protein VPNG_09849 [Cytospora leucostoma]
MVLLTMTPSIVKAIGRLNSEAVSKGEAEEDHLPKVETEAEVEIRVEVESRAKVDTKIEPSLDEPKVGKPISHAQIVHLWKQCKMLDAGGEGGGGLSLEILLRGANLYVPPPPPKPEPSKEYKALMARLRRDEEERRYQRMVSSPNLLDSQPRNFAQQFPLADQFAQINRPSNKDDMGDDDVLMNDVHRQVVLVINFLVTIFGCAATLWVLARWWSTPARMFLTMGGTLLVAVAEVAVYSGYVWHLGQAKKNEAKLKEVKEIVQTWVVGKEEEGEKGSEEVGKGKAGDTAEIKNEAGRLSALGSSEAALGVAMLTLSEPPLSGLDLNHGRHGKSGGAPYEQEEVQEAQQDLSGSNRSLFPSTEPIQRASSHAGGATIGVDLASDTGNTKSELPRPGGVDGLQDGHQDGHQGSIAKTTPKSKKRRVPSTTRSNANQLITPSTSPTPIPEARPDKEDEDDDAVVSGPALGTKTKRRLTLHSGSYNSQPPQKRRKSLPKKQAAVQTTLSLSIGGGSGMRECRVCDTVYNPFHPEDAKLHARRHAVVLKSGGGE